MVGHEHPGFPAQDSAEGSIIAPASDGKKDLWCGVEPASLFKSRDGGDTWELVQGISNHAHARQWHPGTGGLCLHTILRQGNRVHVGISTGGHYVSEDGAEAWSCLFDSLPPIHCVKVAIV